MPKLTAACAVLVHMCLGVQPGVHQQRPTEADAFVQWLDDPAGGWLASAHLQRFPDAAIARLLEPGRAVAGPHGKMTAALLTLAKIGEAAVPKIEERLGSGLL